jgi:hypothetical protein
MNQKVVIALLTAAFLSGAATVGFAQGGGGGGAGGAAGGVGGASGRPAGGPAGSSPGGPVGTLGPVGGDFRARGQACR